MLPVRVFGGHLRTDPRHPKRSGADHGHAEIGEEDEPRAEDGSPMIVASLRRIGDVDLSAAAFFMDCVVACSGLRTGRDTVPGSPDEVTP